MFVRGWQRDTRWQQVAGAEGGDCFGRPAHRVAMRRCARAMTEAMHRALNPSANRLHPCPLSLRHSLDFQPLRFGARLQSPAELAGGAHDRVLVVDPDHGAERAAW